MTETERHLLAHRGDMAGWRQPFLERGQLGQLAAFAQRVLQLVANVEMILKRAFMPAGDENEFLDPGGRASSSAYWMTGLSTTVSISLGIDLVAGKNRVPRPATGNTAFLTI